MKSHTYRSIISRKLISKKLGILVLSAIIGLVAFLPLSPANARLSLNVPNIGMPGRRVAGASRNDKPCVPSYKENESLSLMALIPMSNNSWTTKGDPTLFFYIPETTAEFLELTVDESRTKEEQAKLPDNYKPVYQQQFKPNKAGIVGFRLPANTLAAGKQYRWSFVAVCTPDDRSTDKGITGGIMKLSNNNSSSELANATPQQRLEKFASIGAWVDTLEELINMKRANPNDPNLQETWKTILTTEGVDLDKQLLSQPILGDKDAPKAEQSLSQNNTLQ
jgi:Domain of Unknown Function (DUF928)